MDKDVIHIDGDIAFVDELAEEVIHHQLKGGRSIHEAKEHDHRFEEAVIHLERGLPLITVTHSNVVIPPLDIQLHEECQPAAMHSHESIHKLSDEWERGSILDGKGVQSAVILDRLEITILLFNEEKGECIRGFGLADVPLF